MKRTAAFKIAALLSLALFPLASIAQVPVAVVGGERDDTAPRTVVEGDYDSARITENRAIHHNIRRSDGVELGTVTNPLVVSSYATFSVPITKGFISTSATTTVTVRSTTYTEPTTNAQRSISSSSANDTAAGTGARKVKIVYLTLAGVGPFEETITLNGTTPVNTVATNIGVIERIEVVNVGSTGSNVGTITLFNATAGGGGAIGTIAATANQTFWAHHYVPADKVANVTGISCGHNGTTVGSGGLFIMRAKSMNGATDPDQQVSDFIRLYGQSSTISRVYQTPIKITGPSRLTIVLTPETSSATIYRAAIDYFEL